MNISLVHHGLILGTWAVFVIKLWSNSRQMPQEPGARYRRAIAVAIICTAVFAGLLLWFLGELQRPR